MSTDAAFYQLMSWMSPSYPVGAFTFSQGLENAVETGRVTTANATRDWLVDQLRYGAVRADLTFLAEAWDVAGDATRLENVRSFALAFQPTSELRLETTAQGDAFLRASADAWSTEKSTGPWPYPVAVGWVARQQSIDKRHAMIAFAQAFIANLVSAAVRLVPLGQTDGQKIIAALMPEASAAVDAALETPLEEVSTATLVADICSMQHETQYTRLFRS